MSEPLDVQVCKNCAWDKKKVRRALKALRAQYGERIDVKKVGCLELCKKDPAVIVGDEAVAPAKPKRLRRAVEEKLL